MSVIYRLLTFGLWGGPPKYPVGETDVPAQQRQPASPVTEYRRTCERCGNVWYVTPADAKMRAPGRSDLAGYKMHRGTVTMSRDNRARKALLDRERFDAISRCSSCGSVAFTEEPA